MALNDCKDAIVKALGRVATDREVAAITRRAKEFKDRLAASEMEPGAFLEAELGREKAARIIAKQDAYKNYVAEKALKEWHNSSPDIFNNPKSGIAAKLQGTLKNLPGGRDSLFSRMDRASDSAWTAMWVELQNAGVAKLARDGSLDKEVGNAMWDINHGRLEELDRKYGKDAAKIAQILTKHNKKLVDYFNAAGGHITPAPDNIGTRMYDGNSVAKAGGNRWGSDESSKEFVDDAMKADWNKSFDGELAGASDEEKRKVLASVWANIVGGKHPDFEGAVPGAGRGRMNLAKHGSAKRDIVFKNADDEVDWLKKYGRGGSLAEMQSYSIHRKMADAEIIRRFGANPKQTWDNWLDSWYSDLKAAGNAKGMQILTNARAHAERYIWPAIASDSGVPTGHPVAKMLSWMRGTALISAKVGASITANIGDIPAMASRNRFWSKETAGGYIGSLAKTTASLFHDGMTEADRRNAAIAAGLHIQDVMFPMGPVVKDQYSIPNRMSRFSQHALKWSSHSWYGNRIHTNAAVSVGFEHANMLGKSYEDLRPETKRELAQFGIKPAEWEVIRKADPSKIGPYKSLQKDDIDRIPLEEFKGLAPIGASDKVLGTARQEVSDKYRNLIGERSVQGTAYPSRALKASMTFGTQAGTIEGELVRNVGALKNFIYGYTRDVLGGELFGYDVQPDGSFDIPRAIWKTLTSKGGGRAGIAWTIAGGVAAGFVHQWLQDIVNGKTPEDPFTDHALQRAISFQALGIYGDVLMAQARSNSDRPTGAADRMLDVMGPGFSTAADIADIFTDATYDASKPGGMSDKEVGRLFQRVFGVTWKSIPGNNIYWAKAALDYAFYNNLSEMMNPGYQERLKKAAAKHGQQYIAGGPGPQTSQ